MKQQIKSTILNYLNIETISEEEQGWGRNNDRSKGFMGKSNFIGSWIK